MSRALIHGTMLAIVYRLLVFSAGSALSWLLYQIAVICRHGAVLARQFRSPPPRSKLMGVLVDTIAPSPSLRRHGCTLPARHLFLDQIPSSHG